MDELIHDKEHFTSVDSVAIINLTLKASILFFIALQARILNSHGYRKFINDGLHKHLELAKIRRICINYKLNNHKIRQVIKV